MFDIIGLFTACGLVWVVSTAVTGIAVKAITLAMMWFEIGQRWRH